MARARDEADPQALEVVVRAVAGVDLELAPVARAGVNVADGERAPEVLEQRLAQPLFDFPLINKSFNLSYSGQDL